MGTAQVVVSLIGITLSVVIGILAARWTLKKAEAEPKLMESSHLKNQVEMKKTQLEMKKTQLETEKLELELLEKKANLSLPSTEDREADAAMYEDFIEKQDEFMKKQQEYMSLQKKYIDNAAKPTLELVGNVQVIILKFIALFLIIQFDNVFNLLFDYFVDIVLFNFRFLSFIFKLLPKFAYIVIILAVGIPLFYNIEEIVELNINNQSNFFNSLRSLVSILNRFKLRIFP